MRLSELTIATVLKPPTQDVEFEHLSIDTRTLQPGDVFVALLGDNFNGHHFLEDAKAKGAAAFVISENVETDLPVLKVSDTRLALGQIAALHRQQFDLPIVAITGSSGKTTVKEMIASILSQAGNVLATSGNFNNDIGVPLTLMRLSHAHDFAVIELGANHVGEIAYTTELVKPQVALINNVAPAHVEGFESVDGIASAKAEIYQGLPKDGTAIINADDNYAGFWREQITSKNILSFASLADADVKGRLLHADANGKCRFVLSCPLGECKINLPLPGCHNVMNALAAASACYAIGIPLEQIKAGLESVSPVKGRLQSYPGLQGASIIDDTYNANPGSVTAALNFLASLSGQGIFILGDMGELGADAESYHATVGEQAKQLGIHTFLTCGQLSSAATKAFGSGAMHFTNQADLMTYLKPLLNEKITCLVKGSRSAHMEDIVSAITEKKV